MTSRFLISGVAALLVLASAGELNSEYVNLTTYYPAPSGVYTQMLTTGRTFLAQNTNSGVGVGFGSTNFPPSGVTGGSSLKLGVAGSVGVGAVGGGFVNAALSVPNNPNDIVVQGRIGIGSTRVHSTDDPDNAIGLSKGNGLIVRGRVRVGAGLAYDAAEAAKRSRSYLYLDNSDTGCVGTAIAGNNQTSICNGGEYATFVPGLFVNGWWYQHRGGQVIAQWGGGANDWTTQVWGMGFNGNPNWLTLGKNDKSLYVHCCPK
ncbi:MAG: hypothetical protein HY924_01685 [Elusimicrobia bacterium]|nr:hypothetical protein [Elusimicrobiota bacterium]